MHKLKKVVQKKLMEMNVEWESKVEVERKDKELVASQLREWASTVVGSCRI